MAAVEYPGMIARILLIRKFGGAALPFQSHSVFGHVVCIECARARRNRLGVDEMRSGDVALRLSVVFAVAGSIALVASLYEIDRREKRSSETVTANLTEIEQRPTICSLIVFC